MRREELLARVRALIAEPLPLPGKGHTAERHQRLFRAGREDLAVARLVEAHWDAEAILAEAGRAPEAGALYGVWAAEAPDKVLHAAATSGGFRVSGSKPFCSGAGMVDRALVTVKEPVPRLLDVDLRGGRVSFDDSSWKTNAFAETKTALATFEGVDVLERAVVGEEGFYLKRPGFWHGACGPAACWAGGAAGLVDWAIGQRRDDPHTMAHLGAMRAAVWSMEALLRLAGDEIDASWGDVNAGMVRALTVRHAVEQGCTDVLRRLARAYGPHPLAMEESIARRYQELDLYVRQSHAERDLEALGRAVAKR